MYMSCLMCHCKHQASVNKSQHLHSLPYDKYDTVCQVSGTQEKERWHYHALCIYVNPIHTSSSNMLVMISHVSMSVYMMRMIRRWRWGRWSSWWWWWYPTWRKALLWVHSPSVQFSVASLFPSHILPRCLGAGELHSRLRCLSHWLLHRVHSLHSSQAPSTTAWDDIQYMWRKNRETKRNYLRAWDGLHKVHSPKKLQLLHSLISIHTITETVVAQAIKLDYCNALCPVSQRNVRIAAARILNSSRKVADVTPILKTLNCLSFNFNLKKYSTCFLVSQHLWPQ